MRVSEQITQFVVAARVARSAAPEENQNLFFVVAMAVDSCELRNLGAAEAGRNSRLEGTHRPTARAHATVHVGVLMPAGIHSARADRVASSTTICYCPIQDDEGDSRRRPRRSGTPQA